MAEFTLHGIPGSPYVRGALLGLEEKGLRYELAAMGFGDMKTPAHLARHPFARIPILDHGDFCLYETQAILRYLDDIAPTPALQPKDARARARMNQLVGISDWYVRPDITAPISRERIVVPKFLGGTPDEAKIAAALPRAEICVRAIEALIGDVYMVGDEVSIADLMLAPHISYFAMTPEGREMMKGGKLMRWIERMDKRPSMQSTTLERMRKAA